MKLYTSQPVIVTAVVLCLGCAENEQDTVSPDVQTIFIEIETSQLAKLTWRPWTAWRIGGFR